MVIQRKTQQQKKLSGDTATHKAPPEKENFEENFASQETVFGELRKCAQKDKGKKKGAKWEDKEGASVRIFRSRRKASHKQRGLRLSTREGARGLRPY